MADALPDPILAPGAIPSHHRFPRTKALRQVAPGAVGLHHPQDAFYDPTMISSRTASRELLGWQKRDDLRPSLRGQLRQARHLEGRPWWAWQGVLTSALGHMAPFGACLMMAPKARPPESLLALLWRFPERGQQATHFWHTQAGFGLLPSPFFPASWVWVRSTTNRAWANRASVRWRYQPLQVRTS